MHMGPTLYFQRVSQHVTWHEISQHLFNRHFWAGVMITLLIIGSIALLINVARHVPERSQNPVPYGFPYSPHRF
jgi:hypothetical protein